MRYLSLEEYETVLRAGLRRLGLSDHEVERLILCRWPLDAVGLVTEAHGRGLTVTLDDVQAFLATLDERLTTANAFFAPGVAERFLQWAVESGRAGLTPVGKLMNERSADLELILQSVTGELN